jgi:topoisomerase-4 subunit A
MDVDVAAPLLSVATVSDSLKVCGSGRGGKTKHEMLVRGALEGHQGRRARKGRKVNGFLKVQRLQ